MTRKIIQHTKKERLTLALGDTYLIMANPSERDMETKGVLILLRHGMSIWNRDPSKKNQVWRYAGSVDIPLSKTGIEEACEAAESIQHIPITAAYTSNLSRAQVTAQIVLCENCSAKVPLLIPDSSDLSSQISGIHGNQARESVLPVYCRAELNERSFGLLEGITIFPFSSPIISL